MVPPEMIRRGIYADIDMGQILGCVAWQLQSQMQSG